MNDLPSIAQRLAQPALSLDLEALAARWFQQTVTARVSHLGHLAPEWRIIPAIRGAWGQRLVAAASPQAIAGEACPWSPPCALDIFFREQVRIGRRAVGRPYVLHLDPAGRDLLVRLVIFGFACEWTLAAAHALTDALNHHIDWTRGHRAARGLTVKVTDVAITTRAALEAPVIGPSLRLSLLTPLDDETGRLRERPALVFDRLARRVSDLAPWQDARLDLDRPRLLALADTLTFDTTDLTSMPLRRTTRGAGAFERSALSGDIQASGPALADLAPLLAFAPHLGAGRGATAGQGRLAVG